MMKSMTPFREHFEEAERDLALQTARVAMFQQALKHALIDAATSPTALITAFGIGILLGTDHHTRGQSPSENGGDDRSSDDKQAGTPLQRLLDQLQPILKWLAVAPAIVGMWRNLQGHDAREEDASITVEH